jgi:hypothetical protein
MKNRNEAILFNLMVPEEKKMEAGTERFRN